MLRKSSGFRNREQEQLKMTDGEYSAYLRRGKIDLRTLDFQCPIYRSTKFDNVVE